MNVQRSCVLSKTTRARTVYIRIPRIKLLPSSRYVVSPKEWFVSFTTGPDPEHALKGLVFLRGHAHIVAKKACVPLKPGHRTTNHSAGTVKQLTSARESQSIGGVIYMPDGSAQMGLAAVRFVTDATVQIAGFLAMYQF